MELLVYKASAGSGKTFTLAVEYIKHLMRDPHAYRQILAVTFTNKATTEMKERIVQQLYGIWKADAASDAYLQAVRKGLQADLPDVADDLEALRQRAGTALMCLLHDYSRFRVETIDSFFQSVMRGLARELELTPDLNIELDTDTVLSDATDSLIRKLKPASPVLAWLLEYIGDRIADDKRWNVSDEIKQFGRNIFNESYLERGEALRAKLRNADVVRTYRSLLRAMQQEALEQMDDFSRRFVQELEQHGLQPADLKGGARGIGSYFNKLHNGRLTDKEVLNATLSNCMNDPDAWAAQSSARRNDICTLAQTTLMPLLREAEQARPERLRTLNSCRLSLQHLDKLRLLNHIDEEVRLQNQAHNRFLLTDTNELLHRLMQEGDSSFIFEKIGANIRNVMIDEFQDTSRMQWANFRLLLLEGLSQGDDSLIVGDVKQSIYRWRGGDWSILNSLGSRTAGATEALLPPASIRVETLKVNRRSESVVIDFNNAVFEAAVTWLDNVHRTELGEECLPLKDAYSDVAQLSPRTERRGYVKAMLLDANADYADCTLQSMAAEIRRLLAEGVRANDIAILVRKNRQIPLIADYMDSELGLPVVSDEAFRLDASTAVCLLMDALRCLANPDDRLARASLTMTLTAADATDAHWPDCVLSAHPDLPLPPAFAEQFAELRMMPLYEQLETLYGILQLERIEKQDAYLFAFFDAVTDYLRNNPPEPEAFTRHWDECLCGKTIPGGEPEGIRILSIHKSKGLEFHTVLLPFCDWKLENETRDQLVWCAPTEPPYNALDLVPVSYTSAMAQSVYRNDYLHERLQLWVDNLNLMYVAFTRPEKNFLLWGKRGQQNTVSAILTDVLPDVADICHGSWDDETGTFESGSLCLSASETDMRKPEATNRLLQQPEKCNVCMTSRTRDMEFRQSNRSAQFIAGDDDAAGRHYIDRGKLLHTVFSVIETEADIDRAIDRLTFQGVIADTQTEEEIRTLTHRALAMPQVKQWYDGTWQLYNERDIIWMDNDRLCNRRPDRVMMRNGQVVVIDFKFGKPRKQYARQVQGYMQLLQRMGHAATDIEGYLWYVDEGSIEAVTL